MIGYTSVTTEQEALDRSRGLKLLALHKVASKSSSGVASRLLDIYNSYENRDGSLIDVLLATPKFAESMSVRTAKYKHSLNCFWNIPGKHQVDGRINRRTSLQHEPHENRVIYNFNYVLYKPDGSDTVESTINKQSESKYAEIRPIMKVMKSIRLENHYSDTSCYDPRKSPVYPHNTRINNRVRMNTPTVNYRVLNMDTNSFLDMLEQHKDLYSLMGYYTSSEDGYVRLISVAIQSIERVYLKRISGEQITPKQEQMLADVSKAFVEYNGYTTHVLYFVNSDTVEYQRMNKVSRRIVRVLVGNEWVDTRDQPTMSAVSSMYDKLASDHTTLIFDKWLAYGFYITKYVLSSCYRLIEYRDRSRLIKSGMVYAIDARKLSRGEKWMHYNKSTLVTLLGRLNNYNRSTCLMLYRRCKTSDIFKAILASMDTKDMILTLPI